VNVWATILETIEAHARCAMVTVVGVEGSAPREPGARLIVSERGFHGTIGGGALEWRALAAAQGALAGNQPAFLSSHVLGPDLGQCCGGRVKLLTEVFDEADIERVRDLAKREASGAFSTRARVGDRVVREVSDDADPSGSVLLAGGVLAERFGHESRPLLLFGAGHVGRALVLALAPLPFAVRWIDARADAFPAAVPGNVRLVHASEPVRCLEAAAAGAFVLVMTHSHALDFDIVLAALAAKRFPHVGLIGSATKRARFVSRLKQAGLGWGDAEKLACPIGIPGIASKLPAAIAAATAVELLLRDQAVRSEARIVDLLSVAGA